MPPRVKLYVGAPESSSLNWEDETGLLHTFSEPFVRFSRLQHSPDISAVPITPDLPSTSSPHPEWRSLPLERQHLATGLSQGHGWQAESQGASFFALSEIDSFMEDLSQKASQGNFNSSTESVEQILSQFYEESYARHEDIVSSQIAAASDFGTSFTTDHNSFNTTEASLELSTSYMRQDIPASGPLSNLKDLPNAAYLHSIQPQVMTVNIIVGIISLPPPRLIRTRRGTNVELIEALVGDGTKSGFGISFWLPSSPSADGGLRSSVEALRPQDVVLMRNVALSSFRGRVYGQSLRKGWTKVHLLYRNRVDHTDIGGCYRSADLKPGGIEHPQIEKTRAVREWVLRFVGAPISQGKGKVRVLDRSESLPPDTQ
ncbi:Uncharacterized protein BP5553_03797 [Venustampulla echinocandica]|uniref:Nucleic acid-binding protein n=1 Tax=Venustampulla echinocandica TaxID=2656787 RepID=A0A370TV97_9HELO|nr:Uncharacterized protein BP5553_03797 [Venustampulla echinocandica]RDL39457.1 Uncharacterized protein BP5553_03797 [Venustampulla echinocandica]